jgi:hypothetical protein
VDTSFLDELEQKLDRNASFEIVRTDEKLYITIDGATIEGAIRSASLST